MKQKKDEHLTCQYSTVDTFVFSNSCAILNVRTTISQSAPSTVSYTGSIQWIMIFIYIIRIKFVLAVVSFSFVCPLKLYNFQSIDERVYVLGVVFNFHIKRKKYIYIKWTEVWIGEYECMYRDLYQTKTKKLSFVRCCFVCCLGVMAQFYLLIICLHAVSCYCCLHHSVARSRALSSLLSACMNWIWVGETNHFKWFYKEYTLVIEEMIVLYGSFEVGVCVFPNFVERFENRLT